MTDDLVAYLLDDLSPERRAEVEAKLQSDVVWRWELERLRECMAASGDIESCAEAAASESTPATDSEPPVDLVKKTCCFVEDSASGKFKVQKKRCTKAKAALSAASCESRGRSWSVADVTIGAGVLLILAALIMPALQQSRSTARRFTCENNLRGWGMASEQYAALNDGQLPDVLPGHPAAVYLTSLVDRGIITEAEALELSVCPDSAAAQQRFARTEPVSIPTTEELTGASGAELYRLVSLLGIAYAVPVGYFDENGRHRGLKFTASVDRPLAADAPLIGPVGVHPVVHIGGTQNVLSEAGCVKPYLVGVLPAEDQRVRDLHLNDQGIPAAGSSPDDYFLAPPTFGPDGPIAPGRPRSVRVELQFLIPVTRAEAGR